MPQKGKKTYEDLAAAIEKLGLKPEDKNAVLSTIAQHWPKQRELPKMMGAALGTGRMTFDDEAKAELERRKGAKEAE